MAEEDAKHFLLIYNSLQEQTNFDPKELLEYNFEVMPNLSTNQEKATGNNLEVKPDLSTNQEKATGNNLEVKPNLSTNQEKATENLLSNAEKALMLPIMLKNYQLAQRKPSMVTILM